jgi:ABC-type phosphate/phosphonate transport system substrate-binding protein
LGQNTVDAFEDLSRHPGALGPIELIPVPDETTRSRLIADAAVDVWWMCGLLTTVLLDSKQLQASVVAAPVFDGQRQAIYHSVMIVRADDPAQQLAELGGRRLVINEKASWSGWHALRTHLDRNRFDGGSFIEVYPSGSHAASIEAVRVGDGDVAAIDHSIWERALRTDPSLQNQLRVIDVTDDWPAPPLSIAAHVSPGDRTRITDWLLAAGPLRGVTRFAPTTSADYDEMRAAHAHSLSLPW